MGKVNFNKEYANKVSKTQWMKDHDHHKDDVDLEVEYAALTKKEDTETSTFDSAKKKKAE